MKFDQEIHAIKKVSFQGTKNIQSLILLYLQTLSSGIDFQHFICFSLSLFFCFTNEHAVGQCKSPLRRKGTTVKQPDDSQLCLHCIVCQTDMSYLQHSQINFLVFMHFYKITRTKSNIIIKIVKMLLCTPVFISQAIQLCELRINSSCSNILDDSCQYIEVKVQATLHMLKYVYHSH